MYSVYVGETGNEEGHLYGCYVTLRGAKIGAGKGRAAYGGDGWSVIRDTESALVIKSGAQS